MFFFTMVEIKIQITDYRKIIHLLSSLGCKATKIMMTYPNQYWTQNYYEVNFLNYGG